MRWFKWFLQRVTGIHKIHDIRYGFGWKMPFLNWAYFRRRVVDERFKGVKPRVRRWQRITRATYHDCTKTGVY